MAVELVDVSLQGPKELNDVRVAIVELLKDIKGGKSIADVSAENLANLFKAVEGAANIPAELSEEKQKTAALSGLMGGEIVGVFL